MGLAHMATQEEQIQEEEDNDGEMNVQVNETEGVDNIEELQHRLLKQVADVDHHIRILQEASEINTANDSNNATDSSNME
jgi:predicted transcriptional regulator